jgi:ATP-dependent Lon protease
MSIPLIFEVAYKLEMNEIVAPVTINSSNLVDFVGNPIFKSRTIYEETPPGVVMGLAWTRLGGAVLYIETIIAGASSKGSLHATGQMGPVMKESTDIAFSFCKGYLQKKSPGNRFFESVWMRWVWSDSLRILFIFIFLRAQRQKMDLQPE